MGSSPDYEAAHRLNPDKFPRDAQKRVIELEAMLGYCAQELAKFKNTTRDQVLADAAKAVGKDVEQLPQHAEPANEVTVTKAVSRGDAKFFGHKERTTFYPIEMKDKVPHVNMAEKNVVYFASEDEATAKGYTAPPAK